MMATYSPKTLHHTPDEGLTLRPATLSDGVEMWRLARTWADDEGLSPYVFLALLRRAAEDCHIVELSGEDVGYVVARPGARPDTICVQDLVLRPDMTYGDVFETLGKLADLERFNAAEYLEIPPHLAAHVTATLGELPTRLAAIRPSPPRPHLRLVGAAS